MGGASATTALAGRTERAQFATEIDAGAEAAGYNDGLLQRHAWAASGD